MTILMPVYLRASYHRHVHRHRVNCIGKPLPRYHDGRDAHDGHLRAYSRQGAHLYFVGSLTPSTNPTNPTRRARSPVPMRSLRPLAASGLSNLPENPTPLRDERDGPSSGLS
jgi:hypothetical protein